MEMDVESRNVIALHGSRIPEMLGTFHLDDHNVQEWSDASQPGTKHRARKEVGKWIDSDKNADIQFQRHEDTTHSDRSREQQRTEVIQGNAPDAAFQIVRSQRQFQDNDEKSGSRVSSVSTSYQMSSTRGIRSTTKTTSNKTTTKTVTVSGGRSDDFENLKMSFQPLDTSTQRERINVSRSGTMGVRRPPTRRHTPAALLSSSPDELHDDTMPGMTLIHEMEESTGMSEFSKIEDPATIAIVGFKNLSPKIRVGFPVEIQLELQSKLRYSNGDIHESPSDVEDHAPAEPREEIIEIDNTRALSTVKSSPTSTTNFSSTTNINGATTTTTITAEPHPTITSSTAFRGKMRQQESTATMIDEVEQNSQESIDANESADALFHASHNSSNNNDLTFSQRRKSYGFESFETNMNESVVPSGNPEEPVSRDREAISSKSSSSTNISRVYNKVSASAKGPVSSYERPASNLSRFSPSSLSRSWDLIQSVANEQQRREANKKLFSSSSDLDEISHSFTSNNKSSTHNKYPQKTIITLNPFEENEGEDSDAQQYVSRRRASSPDFTVDSLEFLTSAAAVNQRTTSQSKISSKSTSSIFNVEKTHKMESPPDVIHHNIIQSDFAMPEKSRKLMKLLDETPDLLNKMSFKNHIPPSNAETLEIRPIKRWEEAETAEDKEFQSNLSYLNESLSRILGEGKDLNKPRGKGTNMNNNYNSSKFSFTQSESTVKNTADSNMDEEDMSPPNELNRYNNYEDDQEFGYNKGSGKPTQVSHTWISDSIDKKPSQHARDNDVTTSISGTNDQYKKAQKKVEFCKTEVHFTPDSGKFHIVETDENKPSTVHLFRRKKKNEKKIISASSTISTSSKTTETNKLIQNISENRESRPKDPVEDEKRKLSGENTSSSQTSIRPLFSRTILSDEDSEGLELVPLKSAAAVVEVGVDKNKNSLFHSFSAEQDSKPEIGINEATVTPTTANNLGSSLNYLNHRSSSTQHMNLNITDNDDDMLGSAELLPPFKLRRDDKLIPDDFDPLIQEKVLNQKSSSHVHNNRTTSHVNKNTSLIDDLLDCLGEDGDEADESRSDMILSNYGELKIQRYLKQLKSPSSIAGSESPTDFLQLDDVDPDDEDASKHFRFDNVLYENGSFVPLATRRSLIEMNNRNRKRGTHSHFHSSDNSSTITSNYSLPNSDRESNFQGDISNHPLKLTAMEATVATGPKPQITSVELKYALDSGNSYFSEPVKRNFKTPNSKQIEQEKVYDVPTVPVKPELRSLPPYNRNGRFSLSSSPAGLSPTRSPTRDTNSYKNSKPPVPILPSKFSSFEKTGAALRERSYAKNQNSDLGTCLPDSVEKHSNHYLRDTKPEPKYVPSKSIVNIGGDENTENISTSTNVNLESDYNLTISHDASFPRSLSPSQNNDEDDPGEEEITISPEPVLSMDHTWKGPAHFESHGSTKGTSVIRSLTFPKSARPEPEWVSKAKSRESRITDWSLVGKQYGSTVSTRKSEPPWISEIRFKSKPVIPAEEIEALPKASVVYPWQPEPTPTNQSGSCLNRETYSSTENISQNTSFEQECTHHAENRESSGHVIITELIDGDAETERTSPTPTGMSNIINDYYNTSNKTLVDLNRDSDSILITPTHISKDQQGNTRKEKKSHSHSHSPDYAEVVDNLERKLLAPLTESTKPPRKPLQTSSSTNKKINNNKLPPTGKPKAPPRPPKPPERISSLGFKSQPVSMPDKKSAVPKRPVQNHSNSSDAEEAILNSRSNTPIHRHPLVKVTKIPTTASRVTGAKAPGPEGKSTSSSKNKAKHHVSVVSETKLMCKSKLMDSPSTYKGGQTESQNSIGGTGSRRLPPKVSTVRSASMASPHRKR